MNARHAERTLIILIAILAAVGLALVAANAAGASGHAARSDACHTFHLYAHQKGVEVQEQQDAEYCGQGNTQPAQEKRSQARIGADSPIVDVPGTSVTVPPVVTPTPDEPVIVIIDDGGETLPPCDNCTPKDHPDAGTVTRVDDKDHPSTNDCPPGTTPENWQTQERPTK